MVDLLNLFQRQKSTVTWRRWPSHSVCGAVFSRFLGFYCVMRCIEQTLLSQDVRPSVRHTLVFCILWILKILEKITSYHKL